MDQVLKEDWDKLEDALKKARPRSNIGRRRTRASSSLVTDLNITRASHRRVSSFITKSPEKATGSKRIRGLTPKNFRHIYEARCEDLGISAHEDQKERFFTYCTNQLRDRKFDLKEAGLSITSAHSIGKVLKKPSNFASVNISRNNLGDEGTLILAKSIKKNNEIVHLDISNADISPNGFVHILEELRGHPSLVSLNISSYEGLFRNRLRALGAHSVMKLLGSSSILQILAMEGTIIGEQGFLYIVEGLYRSPSLVSLNLASTNLGTFKLEDLLHVIAKGSMEQLNISSNSIGDAGADFVARMLSGYYKQPCSLRKLDISKNGMNTPGAQQIFGALCSNYILEYLNIEGNQMKLGPSHTFLELLLKNSSLKYLNLSDCDIAMEGAKMLGDGLSKNHGLSTLILSSNNISDRGALAIAKGLIGNSFLKTLDLSNNRIKDTGGTAIADALNEHPCIQTVNLRENSLKDEAGKAFVELSRLCTSLLSVNLDLNSIDLKYVYQVKENLEANKALFQNTLVPRLKEKCDSLRIDEAEVEELRLKSQQTEAEKAFVERRLQRQIEKLAEIKMVEERKLKKLQEEHYRMVQLSHSSDTVLGKQEEMSEKVDRQGLIRIQDMEFNIKSAEKEILNTEKKSKV